MNIFITGGTGFIGNRLIFHLAKLKDNSIYCLTRNPLKKSSNGSENVHYIQGDLLDYERLKSCMEGMDYVYHLGGYLAYGNIDRRAMSNININGTENVLKAALANNIKRVVYVSSAGIYHPTKNIVANEQTNLPVNHTTHYTKTKAEGHKLAMDFISKNPLDVVSVYPVSVYGKGSPFFSALISSIKKGEVQFIPFSECKLSLIHVDDLCGGIIKAMDKGQKHGRYIFSGQTLTLKEMVLRISQELDIKPKIIRVPDILLFAILRIKSFVCNFIFDFDKGFKRFALYNDEILLFLSGNLVADDSYATIDLDWNPKISIENGFKDMVTDQVSSL